MLSENQKQGFLSTITSDVSSSLWQTGERERE
jgi:hypothetical protein